jgi:hypothetical protein
LQLRAVNAARVRLAAPVAVFVVMAMAEQPTVAVAVPASAMQLAPGPDRDPAAEQHEGDACHGVHHVAEARGELDPGKPDDQGDDKSGHDVTCTRRQGGARRLAARPAALARDQGDRRPMIGDGGMQHADNGDRENQEEGGSCWGSGQHGGLKLDRALNSRCA